MSIFLVSLSVSQRATIGTPIFAASEIACLSPLGSQTNNNTGSLNALVLRFVRVPGVNLPFRRSTSVNFANFEAALLEYILEATTKILEGSN